MPERTECRRLVLEGETIFYTLERKKVKNINMRMCPETGLSVSAPHHVALGQIEEILRQHQNQILTTLRQYAVETQEKTQQFPECYATGEMVLYLGKYYYLEVVKGCAEGVCRMGDKFQLTVTCPKNREHCKRIFDTWWSVSCEKAIHNMCRAVYPVFAPYGIAFPELRFRAMVSQWGNCRPQRGLLTFNTRLLAAPVRCIEYVVIHEFTHFLYPNHSREFYQFIEAEIPDWKTREKLLHQTVQTRL